MVRGCVVENMDEQDGRDETRWNEVKSRRTERRRESEGTTKMIAAVA
jgi:hypothetical protein